jgi:uncharacterized protein (TIGR01777 family)
VTVLTRGEAGVRGGRHYQHWDPSAPGSASFTETYDAVFNLAGEQAVGVRYTEQTKQRILDSRVQSTTWLVRAMERAHADGEWPRVFVCASGTGFYGATLDSTPVDESSPPGSDFLAQVCVQWEAAAERARPLGVRVVSARTAPVLSEQGGALEALLRPFKLFVGGPVGSGKQGFPWIHLDDQIAALVRCADDEALNGPVNLCAPLTVSNGELSRVISNLLGRPGFMKAPGFALKALFGEGAEPLLGGQWPVPRALQRVGFEFKYADVRSALAAILRAQSEG